MEGIDLEKVTFTNRFTVNANKITENTIKVFPPEEDDDEEAKKLYLVCYKQVGEGIVVCLNSSMPNHTFVRNVLLFLLSFNMREWKPENFSSYSRKLRETVLEMMMCFYSWKKNGKTLVPKLVQHKVIEFLL